MNLPWTALPGILKSVLLALILGYLGLALFSALFANRMVFPAPRPSYDGKELQGLKRVPFGEENQGLAVQYLPHPEARHLLFYHHGNGEDLGMIGERLQALHDLGFAVLAWDYPGYGRSGGRASEESVTAAARFLWGRIPEDTGFPHEQVVLYGRSVGGGPAVVLAAEAPAAGLILESTFTSTFRVLTRVRLLPWDVFNNLGRIGELRCPLLLLHGTNDHTVPFAHGKTLFAAAPDPKFFTFLQGGGHNNLVEEYGPTYRSSIERFMEFLRRRQ